MGEDEGEMNKEIKAAYEQHKQAAIALCDTVIRIYPVGMVVLIKARNGNIHGRVERHSLAWWSDPGRLTVTNVKTGKLRTICASDIVDNT
jgi:hypothetical protein